MIITIETTVSAPIERVWNAWISPSAIEQWNFASDDWQCPTATVDLRVGEQFSSRMEAKDGSMGFDFEGTFTVIDPQKNIEYSLDDARKVTVRFEDSAEGVRVIETFEAEDELTGEQQLQGWQAILNNFKHYVESKND